jgi:hypothetical protein
MHGSLVESASPVHSIRKHDSRQSSWSAVELYLTTGRELFEADFVYLMTGQPL